MKRKLISVAVAFAMAVTVAVGASPAQAATSKTASVHPNVDALTIIAAVQKAYGIFKSFQGGGTSASSAASQIIAAIQAAQTAIISHIDAIAAADSRACAEAAVINYADFSQLTLGNQQLFAQNATSCVALIDSQLSAVTDKNAQNQLGFALHAVGPIALMSRAQIGFSTAGVGAALREANQKVIDALVPSCTFEFNGDVGTKEWRCTSFDGGFGEATVRELGALTKAENRAAANTAWVVANAVQPQLQGI